MNSIHVPQSPVKPAANLLGQLQGSGWTPGIPIHLAEWAQKIDRGVCRRLVCPGCNVRGMNYRLTNMQAAIGLAQTEKIDFAVARKREVAAAYVESFRDFEHVTLPVERPGSRNVYWMFGILINDSFGRTKDDVMVALKAHGVDSRSFFYPMSQQAALRGDDPRLPSLKGDRPVSADLARRGLYLPSGIGLTADQIRYCAESVKSLRR